MEDLLHFVVSEVVTKQLALRPVIGKGQASVTREIKITKQILVGQIIVIERADVLKTALFGLCGGQTKCGGLLTLIHTIEEMAVVINKAWGGITIRPELREHEVKTKQLHLLNA